MIKAVLWDFGGVFTGSPFEGFNRYEKEHNIPTDFIRMTNATNPDTNAWAQFESNTISATEFDRVFAEETRARGHEITGLTVLELLRGDIRPAMVEAFTRINAKYKTACLTNNFRPSPDAAPERPVSPSTKQSQVADIMGMFDAIIESSVVGIRKPDPEFYLMACEQLDIRPPEAVFLDDLGINLKPARELGMTTIKVVDPDATITELESVLNIELR